MGNKKPYGNSVKSRRTNYNHNLTKKNSKYTNKKDSSFSKEKKSLENTTRIRIDKERLNDFDSLDTSFLEGRRKKVSNKEVIVNKKPKKKQKLNISTIRMIRNVSCFLGALSLVILIILVFSNNHFFEKKVKDNKKAVVVEKDKDIEESVIDTNCLFLGGFYTEDFSLDELGFTSPYVKNNKEKLYTKDILDSMKKEIYDYNPSIIFLELGISDYLDGKDTSDILKDIESIINQIKENRPYAKIYMESFYPINKDIDGYDDDLFKDIDNDDLIEFNKKLKNLCTSSKVHYVDVFTELSENNKLKKNYTDNGIDLNQDGYKRLFKIIRKIVDSN